MLQTNELTVIALTKWGVGIKRASINLSSTALSTAWLAYHSCVEGYRVVVQSGNSMGQAFKEALNSHQKNVDIELGAFKDGNRTISIMPQMPFVFFMSVSLQPGFQKRIKRIAICKQKC